MGSETVCVPLSQQISLEWYAAKEFDLKIVAEGPWRGIFESKRAGKYQPVRFSVTGTIVVKPNPSLFFCSRDMSVTLYYVGRGGNELEVASQILSSYTGSTELTMNFDKSFDIYTEWRGPGLQGFRLHGVLHRTLLCSYNVEVSGKICMTLTWVD